MKIVHLDIGEVFVKRNVIVIIRRHVNHIPVNVNVPKVLPERNVKILVQKDTMAPIAKRSVAVKMVVPVIMFQENVHVHQGLWDHCKCNQLSICSHLLT